MPELRSADLRAAGEAIVRTITAPPFVRPDGLLTRGLDAHGRPNPLHCLPDLGDYLLFLPLFGGEAFVAPHLAAVARALPDGLLPPQERRGGIPVRTTYEYTDLLQGLFWAADRDPAYGELARRAVEQCIHLFRLGRGTCSVVPARAPQLRLPVLDTRDGMFLELLTGPQYDAVRVGLRDELSRIPAFVDLGLFPCFATRGPLGALPRFRRAAGTFLFMKHNSNAVYGLLALARRGDQTARETLDRWSTAALRHAVLPDGSVVHRARLTRNGLVEPEYLATSTHTAIDLFCELFQETKRRALLDAARAVADRALVGRGATGLFPLTTQSSADDIDVQTDMIVALRKLHELTGDGRYDDAARVALAAALQYHCREGAVAVSVDVGTGKVLDASVKTKFAALFLKALHLYETGGRITDDDRLRALLADR